MASFPARCSNGISSFGNHFEIKFKTILRSQVVLYLGSAGRRFDVPLQNLFMSGLLPILRLRINAIADLYEFIEPYEAPFSNSLVRNCRI